MSAEQSKRVMQSGSDQEPLATRLLIALIVIVALVYGRPVLMPFALAALFAFILSPIVAFLVRVRVPRPAAVSLVLAASIGIALVASAMFTSQVIELTDSLSTYRANLAEKVKIVSGVSESGAMKRATDLVGALQRELDMSGNRVDEKIRVVIDEDRGTGITAMVHALLSTLGPLEILLLTLVYTAVLLAEQYDIVDRVVRLAGEQHLTKSTFALGEAGERLSRFFLAQTLINGAFGAVIGVALGLLGIPNAALWGMTSFVLRFVPWVGVALAAAPPLLLAAAVTPGWDLVGATVLIFFIGELAMGNFVEPVVLGRHTGLSPLAIIAAASFWSFVWGVVGLVLASPLTVALMVLGDYIPAFKFLSLLLGDRPPLLPEQEYYRRLLSDDAIAAAERFESEMESRDPAEVGDALVFPALRLAARDYREDKMGAAKVEEIGEAMEEVERILGEALDKRNLGKPHPEGLPEAERVVIPAHGPIDQIAAEFAAFLLTRTTGMVYRAAKQSSGMMALSSLKEGENLDTMVIISVGGVSRSHLRLLARKAAADFSRTRIVLSDFGEASDIDEQVGDKTLPSGIIRCNKLARAGALLQYLPADKHGERSQLAAVMTDPEPSAT